MAGKIVRRLYGAVIVRVARLASKLRILHFRLMGIRIGRGCFIARGVVLSGNVTIGEQCSISAYANIGTAFDGVVEIGNDCHIGKSNQIGSSGAHVKIGDQCIFAPFVMITDGVHEFRDAALVIKHAPVLVKPVELGANVWLGYGVMVTQGVTIGAGAVLGAKALANRDIPGNAVAVGIPAKVISYREQGRKTESSVP